MGKLVDNIIAKGRGNLKPLPAKAKKQPSFTHNLDPIMDNKVDEQNRERILNDPSRTPSAATMHGAQPGESVTRNDQNDGINAATLSFVTELERKFELSYENLARLLGLGNGTLEIVNQEPIKKLFIVYKPIGIKADKVINDNDVNKADDKQTAV